MLSLNYCCVGEAPRRAAPQTDFLARWFAMNWQRAVHKLSIQPIQPKLGSASIAIINRHRSPRPVSRVNTSCTHIGQIKSIKVADVD